MILTHYMHFLELFPHCRTILFDVTEARESRDPIKKVNLMILGLCKCVYKLDISHIQVSFFAGIMFHI